MNNFRVMAVHSSSIHVNAGGVIIVSPSSLLLCSQSRQNSSVICCSSSLYPPNLPALHWTWWYFWFNVHVCVYCGGSSSSSRILVLLEPPHGWITSQHQSVYLCTVSTVCVFIHVSVAIWTYSCAVSLVHACVCVRAVSVMWVQLIALGSQAQTAVNC